MVRYCLVGLALLITLSAAHTSAAPAACASEAHRQFDFWLGEWEVYSPAGKLAGTNSIQREYDGCVVHERYTTAGGYRGESLNIYDPTRGTWHQTWVDNSGTLLLLDGGFRDGAMVLEGETRDADAKVSKHRITWTPLPDGGLRQHWQTDAGDGKWVDTFDGRYKRK